MSAGGGTKVVVVNDVACGAIAGELEARSWGRSRSMCWCAALGRLGSMLTGLRWQTHCQRLLCRVGRAGATGIRVGDGGDGKWPPWLVMTRGTDVSDRRRFRLGGREGGCGDMCRR